MTEPPLKMAFHDEFYTGRGDDPAAGPRRSVLRSTAKRLAFQAVVGGRVVAQFLRGSRVDPGYQSFSSSAWLIASPDGSVTAHRRVAALQTFDFPTSSA